MRTHTVLTQRVEHNASHVQKALRSRARVSVPLLLNAQQPVTGVRQPPTVNIELSPRNTEHARGNHTFASAASAFVNRGRVRSRVDTKKTLRIYRQPALLISER